MSYLGGFDADDTGAARSLARNMAATPTTPAPKPEPMVSNPLSAPSNAAPIRPTSYAPVRQVESSSYAPVRPTEPIGSYAAGRPLTPAAPPPIRAPEPVSTYTPSYIQAAPQPANPYSNPLAAPEGRGYAEQTAPAPTNSAGFQIPNAGYNGDTMRQEAQKSIQRMNSPVVNQNGELLANGSAGSFANSLGDWTTGQRASDPTNYSVVAGTPEYDRSLRKGSERLTSLQANRARSNFYDTLLQANGHRGDRSGFTTVSGGPREGGPRQASFTNDGVVDLMFRRAEEAQSFGRG